MDFTKGMEGRWGNLWWCNACVRCLSCFSDVPCLRSAAVRRALEAFVLRHPTPKPCTENWLSLHFDPSWAPQFCFVDLFLLAVQSCAMPLHVNNWTANMLGPSWWWTISEGTRFQNAAVLDLKGLSVLWDLQWMTLDSPKGARCVVPASSSAGQSGNKAAMPLNAHSRERLLYDLGPKEIS